MDHRTYGVHHIPARKVVSLRDTDVAPGLLHPIHDVLTLQPHLHPGERVDGVIYASVTGCEASEHPAVRRVHYGIAPQCGDITPPQGNAVTELEYGYIGDAFPVTEVCQDPVLCLQQIIIDRFRGTNVHQCT